MAVQAVTKMVKLKSSLACQCHAKQNPEKNPAYLAKQQFLKQYSGKLRLLFRNSHTDTQHKKSISDYNWLCNLDEAKNTLTKMREFSSMVNLHSCKKRVPNPK